MTPLSVWENFYVIVGSAAGALIGLQFVVMALVADMPIGPNAAQAGHTYGTPTVVHFAAVLLLAAILVAPWHGLTGPAILWGLMSLGGIIYATVVARRMRQQNAYQPELEDWMFHVLLPYGAHFILAVSSVAAFANVRDALFGVAAAALLLLFTGIHNAWDGVTYHVYVTRRKRQSSERQD